LIAIAALGLFLPAVVLGELLAPMLVPAADVPVFLGAPSGVADFTPKVAVVFAGAFLALALALYRRGKALFDDPFTPGLGMDLPTAVSMG